MDPQELLSLAQDVSEGGRANLASAVSDFFKDQNLNEKEQELASTILLNLIRQAEIDLRQALADRLSVQAGIPKGVILFLANDEISVADKVLMHSPVLQDIDLVNIIEEKGEAYWQSIAKRETLSPHITNKLIDTGDVTTVLHLVDNERTNLAGAPMKKIMRIALLSEELQAPLLRRPEVDAEVATSLYMIVSKALCDQIKQNFNINQQQIDQAMEVLVQELNHEARQESVVTETMMALASRFMERDEVNTDLMIRTLRRGQLSFFIALFARKINFLPEAVHQMIQKDNGKGFIVACRYLRMMKSEFASIFLLSRGIRTGDRIVDQRELAMALKRFDSLKEPDVERVMDSWSKNPDLI